MRLFEIESKPYTELNHSSKKIIDRYGDQIKTYLANGGSLYRGMKWSTDVFIGDGDALNRKSANTDNYYTLITQLLPSWNGWPPRNKSFIGSTSVYGASAYGTSVFHLIPLENQPVAICNGQDFWDYADKSFRKMGLGMQGLDLFNREFKALQYLLNKTGANLPDVPSDSVQEMKAFLGQMQEAITNIPELAPNSLTKAETMFWAMKEDGVMNLLNEVFDPAENGCRLVKANDLKFDKEYTLEIWISGKVLFIQRDFMKVIKELMENGS